MVVPLITERDLIEAIAECQGQRNPNSSTCIKLAAFYTILDHIRDNKDDKHEEEPIPVYSYSAPPDTVMYQSDSKFSNAIHGMDSQDAWSVVDELMDTLSVVNPRLYNGVMRKIKGGL